MIWTAVGGRGTIIGAFVGTFLVKGAEFLLSGILASFWQLIMAALFIFVVLVFRDGIVGSIANWIGRRNRGTLSQICQRCRSHGARPAAGLAAGGRGQAGRGAGIGATAKWMSERTFDMPRPVKDRRWPTFLRSPA